MTTRSIKWPLYAGAYVFVCAIGLLLLVRREASLVAEVLGLPNESVVLFAIPASVIGALLWSAIVEERGAYAYRLGGLVGTATAILTMAVWILRGVVVWGPDTVLLGWPLIAVIAIPTVPTGALAGLALMYVRRRSDP